jgi:hypothetical protein
MESKLQKLSLQRDKPNVQPAKPESKSPKAVAESWEDEVESSDSDTEIDEATRPPARSPVPNAPPPTPISPTSPFQLWDPQDSIPLSTGTRDGDAESGRRPEKSTAVAGRLIAAGLGMRAPKKTEEQRAYDKAVRENEIRRRMKEKESKEKEREDTVKARSAIWES